MRRFSLTVAAVGFRLLPVNVFSYVLTVILILTHCDTHSPLSLYRVRIRAGLQAGYGVVTRAKLIIRSRTAGWRCVNLALSLSRKFDGLRALCAPMRSIHVFQTCGGLVDSNGEIRVLTWVCFN